MTKTLVMGYPACTRQIQRGKSYVAYPRPNQMVVGQNQPSPAYPPIWAESKILAFYFLGHSLLQYILYLFPSWASSIDQSIHFFGPAPFNG
jgi:hypothetical protein